tara:strand:- start:608 stop:1138 length:531 start_codon:yes stop_codon:yes gene_type:complete
MIEISSQSALPFQLSDLRDHCRVSDRAHDPSLRRCLNAAASIVERWSGLFFRSTTVDAYFRGKPEPYRFQYGPVTSVTSVTNTTDSYTISSSSWELDKTTPWPTLRSTSDSVWSTDKAYAVRYVAGYSTVPDPLKVAVFELAALHFENREAAIPNRLNSLPFSIQSILQAYGPRGM